MLNGIEIRIYPNQKQKVAIAQNDGCCRFVYNHMVAMQSQRYENGGSYINAFGMNKLLPVLKREYGWLKDADSTSLQYACECVHTAYQRMFRWKSGYPNFHRKSYERHYTIKNTNESIRFEDERHIKLNKLGILRCSKNASHITGRIHRATIRCSSVGRYYASITYEVEDKHLPNTGHSIGLDMGLHALATLSNGKKYELQRFDKQLQEELTYWQRKSSRRLLKAKEAIEEDKQRAKSDASVNVRTLMDFKNYQKARKNVARIHEKIRRQREDNSIR